MCLTMACNYRIFYVHPWPQMNHFFYCDSELSSINLTNKTHEDGGEVQKFSFGHRDRQSIHPIDCSIFATEVVCTRRLTCSERRKCREAISQVTIVHTDLLICGQTMNSRPPPRKIPKATPTATAIRMPAIQQLSEYRATILRTGGEVCSHRCSFAIAHG